MRDQLGWHGSMFNGSITQVVPQYVAILVEIAYHKATLVYVYEKIVQIRQNGPPEKIYEILFLHSSVSYIVMYGAIKFMRPPLDSHNLHNKTHSKKCHSMLLQSYEHSTAQ